MLSIEYCKKVLEQNGKVFTREQVATIRNLLYHLAKIQIAEFKRDCHD
jgi:hypothetical protein